MHVNSMSPDSNCFVIWSFAQMDLTNKALWNLQSVFCSCITFVPSMIKGITQVMIRQELHESFCCSFTGYKWYLIPWVQFLMTILGHSDSAAIYQWRDDQGHGKPSTSWAKQWVFVTSTVSEIISLILKGGRGCLSRWNQLTHFLYCYFICNNSLRLIWKSEGGWDGIPYPKIF